LCGKAGKFKPASSFLNQHLKEMNQWKMSLFEVWEGCLKFVKKIVLYRRFIYKILSHTLVWLIFGYLSFRHFKTWLPANGFSFSDNKIIVHEIINTLLLVLCAYFNYLFLLPQFFIKRKYIVYLIFLSISFVIISLATAQVDVWFLLPHRAEWIMSGTHIWSRLPYLVLFVLLANWSKLSEELISKQKQETQLWQAKTEAELRWLKAQVNPHFLFNALHNIYTLVYLKSELAAPMLVKLSEMMRYLFQDSQQPQIPVSQEIMYLENYIALQSLKKRWQPKIFFTIENSHPGTQIEPMLFINFIENAFKHSNLDKENAYVKISLSVAEQHIIFTTENTFENLGIKDKTSGIGLENIQQRLQLLYPGKHQLDITDRNGIYRVNLTLHL
jgi:sensor histidine kinase YesM